MSKTTIALSTLTILTSLVQAATITVSSYSYGAVPPINQNYLDTGGIELTDGVLGSTVWTNPAVAGSPTVAEIAPLVGWQNSNPSITFDFGSTQTVRQVQVWSADSDGGAAVLLPATITVRTPDSSFSQVFPITDPAGNGTIVRLDLTGFEVTTDSLVIEPRRANPGVPLDDWIMLSEVRFDTVPEPSSALLGALGFLGFTARRQRKQS